MISELTLRPLRAEDGIAVADLHRRAILALSARFYSKVQLKSWAHGIDPDAYATYADSGSVFTVAETSDGSLSGVACHARAADGKGRIMMLYVDPDMQGLGIGSRLLAAAEAALADLGASQIQVESSLAAVLFYLARGYTEEHRELRPTRGGLAIPVRWMRKVISG